MRQMEAFILKPSRPFPNNEAVPVRLYRGLGEEWRTGQSALKVFAERGWTSGWINGIYTFPHFHSTDFEALVCLSGTAEVQLGGPLGRVVRFEPGVGVILPPGTAHQLLSSDGAFSVAGAYPRGEMPDMMRGTLGEWEKALESIPKVPLPQRDPFSDKPWNDAADETS
jgi:uncharacterized protein YjlB